MEKEIVLRQLFRPTRWLETWFDDSHISARKLDTIHSRHDHFIGLHGATPTTSFKSRNDVADCMQVDDYIVSVMASKITGNSTVW